MTVSTILSPVAETGAPRHPLRDATEPTPAHPHSACNGISTVSTARVPLSEPSASASTSLCRRSPTAASAFNRRRLPLHAVSGPRLPWLTYQSVIFGSRENVSVAESCPYSVRRVLTVSVRRAVSPAGIRDFPGRAVTSRTRARAKDGPGIRAVARHGSAQGLGFRRDSGRIHLRRFRDCFFHLASRWRAPVNSSRRATGPAILSRQSSKPASCASSRVTVSSAMPLSITR